MITDKWWYNFGLKVIQVWSENSLNIIVKNKSFEYDTLKEIEKMLWLFWRLHLKKQRNHIILIFEKWTKTWVAFDIIKKLVFDILSNIWSV